MKKTLSNVITLLLAMLMLVSSVTVAQADSFVVGGEYFSYYETQEGLIINGYSGNETDIVIPEEIDGAPVVGIGSWAFNYKESIKSITLPDSLQYIYENAIVSCENLTEIIVCEENEFFRAQGKALYTKDMTELILYFGSSETSFTVPSGVKKIRAYAFDSGKKLENITLPSGLERIEGWVFNGCSSLQTIKIPETVTYLGNSVFPREIKNIEISDSVTLCDDNFHDYEALESISIGAKCKLSCFDGWEEGELGSDPFFMCYDLESINVSNDNPYYSSVGGVLYTKDKAAVLKYPQGKESTSYVMPSEVKYVAAGAVSNVNALESVTFSENIEVIMTHGFNDNEKLQTLTFPESLKSVAMGAFRYCTSITSVSIGKNAKISKDAFTYLSGLESFTLDSENPYHTVVDGVLYNIDATELIAFPAGKSLEGFTFPETLRKVDYHIFDGVPEYEEIWGSTGDLYVGDVLLRVEGGSFEYIIKEGTRLVGEMAFWANYNISTLVVPEGVEILDEMSLCDIRYLNVVYLPKSLEYMGEDVFWACGNLQNIYYAGTEEEWNAIEKEEQWQIKDIPVIFETSYAGNVVTPPEEDYYDHEYIDIGSGISVSTDTEAELSVENIMTEEIVASIDELLPKATVESVFEINLESEGEEVQPVDTVTVKIPTNNRFARVYRMEEDGTLTDMNARYEDGYLIFTTDHFSCYALGQRDASLYDVGDADMDEKITVKDATTVQKHLASLEVYQPDAIELLMDFDGDENLSVRDATAIQKAVAGLK